MFCCIEPCDGDSDVGGWLSVEDDGECGGAAGFCGEEIAPEVAPVLAMVMPLVSSSVFLTVVVVVSCCVTTGVGGGGGEGGGDIAVNEGVINTGDGDGLGCIPVGGCEA